MIIICILVEIGVKTEIFCDIINVFTVTFDHFDTSLPDKVSISL